MANGPPSENSPPWLKPLVTPLTVGGRHFSTCPGVALPHVEALLGFKCGHKKLKESDLKEQHESGNCVIIQH